MNENFGFQSVTVNLVRFIKNSWQYVIKMENTLDVWMSLLTLTFSKEKKVNTPLIRLKILLLLNHNKTYPLLTHVGSTPYFRYFLKINVKTVLSPLFQV